MEYQFETYLLKRGYRPVTANGYRKLIVKYFEWCEDYKLNPNETSLDELYEYKSYNLNRGASVRSTSQLLSVLKHYFMFTGRNENPALLIKHKKQERNLPSQLLSEEELKAIFQGMNSRTLIQRRDKLMIGMVLFQGLKREELNNIELADLDLNEAKVYIRETSRTNSRTLELHPLQINHFYSYVFEYRNALLNLAQKETDKLFFSMGAGAHVKNSLQRKVNEMKKVFSQFRDLKQIKESRMAIWTKEYGVRKAQYLTGIKYASSMLRYKTADLEKLKHKLSIVHPMERINK